MFWLRTRWGVRRIPGTVFRNVLILYLVVLAVGGGFSYLGSHPELVQRISVVSRAALNWALTDGIEVFPRFVQRIPISTSLAQSMLSRSMPSLKVGSGEVSEILITEEVIRDILAVVTNYDLQQPASFFQGQIPAIAVSGGRLAMGAVPQRDRTYAPEPSSQVPSSRAPAPEPEEDAPAPVTITASPRPAAESGPRSDRPTGTSPIEQPSAPRESAPLPQLAQPQPSLRLNLGREPLVAIYHTHTGETYRTEDNVRGKSYAWDNYEPSDGPIPGVVQVGVVIAEELRTRFGIPVVHSTKIHDYPVWSRAYWNSRITAQELVNAHKELRLVLDIHRDEGTTISATTGENVSRVLLVVTSAEENADLPHPRWRENLAFAQVLHRKFEELYPGLSKGIQIRKDNRFNQHVHPRALLLEVGGSEDTLEQALSTARLCAHVIAEVIYDELAATGGYGLPGSANRQSGSTPPLR